MKPDSDSSVSVVSILLALVAIAASLAFPPIQQIRDSLYWAKEVEQGTNLYALLNPHHLSYLPAMRALFVALTEVCASCRAIQAAQVVGVVFSAIATVAVFHLTRRLSGSTLVAAALALALIFSRTFWIFAMQVSPYVPLVATLALLGLAVVARGERVQNDRGALLAVATPFAAAVLLHQGAILIGFALLAYFFASRPRRDAWRALLRLALCSGGIVLVAYLLAFAAIFGAGAISFDAVVTYLTRYASTNNPCCATFANFSLEGVTTLLGGHLEAFMTPPWALRLPTLYAFGLGLLLLIGWNVYRAASGDRLALRLFFVSWLVIMLGFLLWAYPVGGVPPMLSIVPILALLSLAAGDFLQLTRPGGHTAAMQIASSAPLLVLVVLLAVRNFDDGIAPMHSSLGKKYEKATLLAQVAPKRCTILEGDQEVLMHLYYYLDRTGLDAWDLMTWFYFAKTNKRPFTWETFRFSGHDCIVVDAAYLSPTVPVLQRVAADSRSERWYAYIEWLLGFEYENGRVSSIRCIGSVADSRGSRYLVIDSHDRCGVAGFDAVIERLDTLLGPIDGPQGVATFSEWFRQHREAVPGFRQRRFRDILSDEGPWPVRPLARGPAGEAETLVEQRPIRAHHEAVGAQCADHGGARHCSS